MNRYADSVCTFQMNQKTKVNSEILSQPPNSQSKTYYLPKIVKFCTYRPYDTCINNSYQIPTFCLNHCWDDNEIITAV